METGIENFEIKEFGECTSPTEGFNEISKDHIGYLKELDIDSNELHHLSDDEKHALAATIDERLSEISNTHSVKKQIAEDVYNKELLDALNPYFEKNGAFKDIVGLSNVEKNKLQEENGWSEKIVDAIKSPEEAKVYSDAKLKEINGNLERTDIDWNSKIPQDRLDRMRTLFGDEVAEKWSGKTNLDLIKEGKAPYGPDGERVNLHHIGQKPNGSLAELTNTEHKVYDAILHDKKKTSEIERPLFRIEREAYWRNRYEELIKK